MKPLAVVQSERQRRAMFFDASEYSAATIREYSARVKKYVTYAAHGAFDPVYPEPHLLADYFTMLTQTISSHAARRAARAIAYYFRTKGAPNLLAHPDVDASIFGPLAEQTSCEGVLLQRRAQYFSDHSTASGTLVLRAIAMRSYLSYAADHGFDAKHPPTSALCEYLRHLGATRKGRTVRSHANSIAHFFRSSGVRDLIHTAELQNLILRMVRSSASNVYEPLFVDDVKRLLRGLSETNVMDIRDRLLLLCFGFGGMTSELARSLDRSRIELSEHGVTFYTDAPRRPRIFIGGVDDKELDIRRAMQRWLAIIGRSAGPLFPQTNARGGFSDVALGRERFRMILLRLIAKSGMTGRYTTISLRKGLAIRLTGKVGPVATAEALGYSMSGLRNSVSLFGEGYRKMRVQQRRNQGRWNAKPGKPRRKQYLEPPDSIELQQ